MKRRMPTWPILVSASVLITFQTQIARAAPELHLKFVDVGEGDATIIEYRSEGSPHTVVVDAGNYASGVKVHRAMSHPTGLSSASFIVTHPHPDHMGGMFSLLELRPFGNTFDNGQPFTEREVTEVANRWYLEALRSRADYMPLVRGDVLLFTATGVKVSGERPTEEIPAPFLKVLWSPARRTNDCSTTHCPTPAIHGSTTDWPTGDWNSNSLVLELVYGSFSALLMGDANRITEQALLASIEPGFGLGKTVLLKAGHHGAADTGSPEFLARVDPKYVVISVNSNNVNGYPSSDLIKQFQGRGSAVLRTDQRGTINLSVARNGTVNITSEREAEK